MILISDKQLKAAQAQSVSLSAVELFFKQWDAVFIHSPFCGTCQLASRMLEIVEATNPNLEIAAVNVGSIPLWVSTLQIESVPCLLVWDNRSDTGNVDKIYAFHSVSFLYERLKSGKIDS
ncbi:thioredoxin family protein [Paenibacillus alvei]|uniref:Thioredoxin family protein n=1 Tax=Paenibacillus alvei TaxID=44250 RepID=A0ABT4H653_PAEAL|nr:thioredoxin family protein [Paenibacillus alvei]EJW15692.1 thioredoxin [Paenibacillus alvei DSM 29]MCY9543789.1 thioredoxin family protein [Paenibacillus alvei]MCY9707486.1 thioredoxin family protein [Paenibacillus alvei]MCY9734112.1 thioredoxin family protein [Paenibacillus alvei]MCY9756289.1 thioredoxin family protein [Paenibacillus alvei]